MALSEEQKRIVRESISHLLDFSTQPSHFREQMQALTAALTETVSEENDYYWIGETWRDPGNYLKSIAQLGESVTVGEVRAYLIDYLTETINLVKLDPKPFDPAALLNLIPKSAYKTPFEASKTRVNTGESLWDLPPLEGHLFTRQLHFEETDAPGEHFFDVEDWQSGNEEFTDVIEHDYQQMTKIVLEVNVTIHGKTFQRRRELETLRTIFRDDNEEADYIARIKHRAECDGLHLAATEVLQRLQNITPRKRELKLINYNLPVELVLTHQYYYALVEANKLKLSAIASLKKTEAMTLLDHAIIDLLQKRLVSFSVAKKLNPVAIPLVRHPVYHPMLVDEEIDIEMLRHLDQNRCHFLADPRIANLIQRHQLSFAEAVKLPLFLYPIITHESFIPHFESTPVDWQALGKIRERLCDLLTQPSVIKLIVNNLLPMAEAATILSDAIPRDIALLHLHAYSLAHRCIRIILGNPCQPEDETDSAELIQQALIAHTYLLDCQAIALSETTFTYLVSLLNEMITIRMNEAKTMDEYHTMQHLLKGGTPKEGLEKLVRYVTELQENMRREKFLQNKSAQTAPSKCESTLFHTRKKRTKHGMKQAELAQFCDGVATLSSFILNPPQNASECRIL